MKYFRVRVSINNRLWKNFFTYMYHFFCKESTTTFVKNYANRQTILELIALNDKGEFILSEKSFEKEEMPFYLTKESILLIRDDFFQEELFTDLIGIDFRNVIVQGEFSHFYVMLSFINILDCIHKEKNKKNEVDPFNGLVLDIKKIPLNIDGFFLDKWDRWGEYTPFVSEILKNRLLMLDKAQKYLLFDEVIII